MTENELREAVSEAISNVKSKLFEHRLDKDMARHELDLYVNELKRFTETTNRVAALMMQTGYKRASYFLASILREAEATINYVENEEVINVDR